MTYHGYVMKLSILCPNKLSNSRYSSIILIYTYILSHFSDQVMMFTGYITRDKNIHGEIHKYSLSGEISRYPFLMCC